MACLFAILDILLNIQHCWYDYWVVPRRKKRELEQQNGTAVAQISDSPTKQQLPEQSADNLLVKPVQSPSSANMQETSKIAKSKDIEQGSDPTVKTPAAHQLRALSAGLLSACVASAFRASQHIACVT